mmetsp:Transcript_23038/g.33843  ORF Transcript_23038/g.33843 Transcript_23038/m.33843 type:complete len:465 (+) Transcript_23038:155-1549(+)
MTNECQRCAALCDGPRTRVHDAKGKSQMLCKKCVYGKGVVAQYMSKFGIKGLHHSSQPRPSSSPTYVNQRLLCPAEQKLEQERIVKQECLRDVLREIPSNMLNRSCHSDRSDRSIYPGAATTKGLLNIYGQHQKSVLAEEDLLEFKDILVDFKGSSKTADTDLVLAARAHESKVLLAHSRALQLQNRISNFEAQVQSWGDVTGNLAMMALKGCAHTCVYPSCVCALERELQPRQARLVAAQKAVEEARQQVSSLGANVLHSEKRKKQALVDDLREKLKAEEEEDKMYKRRIKKLASLTHEDEGHHDCSQCLVCQIKVQLNGSTASIEATDKNGYTLLGWAALGGHLSAIQALVQAGANMEAKTLKGHTVLQIARLHGRVQAAELLITLGASAMNPWELKKNKKINGLTHSSSAPNLHKRNPAGRLVTSDTPFLTRCKDEADHREQRRSALLDQMRQKHSTVSVL